MNKTILIYTKAGVMVRVDENAEEIYKRLTWAVKKRRKILEIKKDLTIIISNVCNFEVVDTAIFGEAVLQE